KSTVQAKEEDYDLSLSKDRGLRRREGYAYLNALFFARHRSLITQPVNKRLAIIAGVAAVGIAVILTVDSELIAQVVAKLGNGLPFLPVLMSMFAVGERASRAMYYHCDANLMRYSFY